MRAVAVALCLTLVPAVGFAQGVLPQGTSFVANVEGEWRLYVVEPIGRRLRHVLTASEPRTPAYDPGRRRVAYVAADGAVREIDLATGRDVVLANPTDELAYTQLNPGSAHLPDSWIAVGLKQGASVDTDLYRLGSASPAPLLTQRSAQFEPSVSADGFLYYSNVHCVVACGRPIAEIWRMHLVSRQVMQLVRTNAMSREPVASPDGRWVYFSSDADGWFHLWRADAETGALERLTAGEHNDVAPAVASDNTVYFIRRGTTGGRLFRRDPGGRIGPVDIGVPAKDVRDLKIAINAEKPQ
ncbi:MAG: hypothetical protein AB1651_08705 [Pseudomonadota bacterium]